LKNKNIQDNGCLRAIVAGQESSGWGV